VRPPTGQGLRFVACSYAYRSKSTGDSFCGFLCAFQRDRQCAGRDECGQFVAGEEHHLAEAVELQAVLCVRADGVGGQVNLALGFGNPAEVERTRR